MVYECAYCAFECQPHGTVYTKWGPAHKYVCPKHGTYFIMEGPMKHLGRQIGPVESWSENHDDDAQTT